MAAVSPRSRKLTRSSLCVALALGALGGLGCDDLKDFRGIHSGEIVQGNFVRGCFADKTRLTLRFDPDYAIPLDDGGLRLPNTISTSDGTFADTPLETSKFLPHDPLSELDFPGPQRLRSYVMMARPESGPLAGRDAFVVISLLQSNNTEVRIMARSADDVRTCPGDIEPGAGGADGGAPTDVGRREYFGLWRLK
ncbi:MAG: hypothetical protein JWN48_3384 [Myxococcaceae bacterium]|nr:hypothetical protein [Myxococcaceae bacterium]